MKRNYIVMLSSKIALMVAALVTAGLINRSLGPELRGFLAEIQTWTALIVICFGFSMDTAIYHFSNRELYPGEDTDHLATVVCMTLVYASFASLFFFLFIYYLPGSVSPTTLNYLLLIIVLIVSTMFSSNLAVFYQARGRMILSAIVGFSQAIINLFLIVFTYYIQLLDLKIILISLIIVQLVAVVVFVFAGTKGQFFVGHCSLSLAKNMFLAGIKQHAATVSTFVYVKVNQLLVIRYCGETQSGLFAVSLSLITAAMIIPSTLQLVLYPRVIQAKDDFDITIFTLRAGLYGWGLIVLALFLLAKPIIFIYGGNEFMASVTPFRILLLTAWFLPLSSFIAPYVIKKGAFLLSSLSAILIGVISIILNFILIPRFSLYGAAWATAISSVVGFFIAVLLLALVARRNPLNFLRIWGVNNE